MLHTDLMRQVDRFRLRYRRTNTTPFLGDYASAFRGSGLVFDDVREYQAGDEIRTIDWNVTARLGTPHVKRYREEREQTIWLVLDSSASMQFGTQGLNKFEVAAELAAVVAFAAIDHRDRVGLMLPGEVGHRVMLPGKGTPHAVRMVREILRVSPMQSASVLPELLAKISQIQRRRCIVILLSDYLADGYAERFKRLGHEQELIALRLTDPREVSWPAAGLIELSDLQTGQPMMIDTNNRSFRELYESRANSRQHDFEQLCHTARAECLTLSTDGTHLDRLVEFFQARERRRRPRS